MRIISDFKKRDILFSHEVPPSVLDREFDYHSKEDRENALFFKYKKQYYCLDQFTRAEDKTMKDKGWDAYLYGSFFSGILVSLIEDNKVKVATYIL